MTLQLQVILAVPVYRKLLSDWFVQVAADRNIHFSQRGASPDLLTFGQPPAPCVHAHYLETSPFLRFEAINSINQDLVDEMAFEAIRNTETKAADSQFWYTSSLQQNDYSIPSHSLSSNLLMMLGFGTSINGWRRLGRDILLNFEEKTATERDGKIVELPFPKNSVSIYIAVPAPVAGDFASHIAQPMFEIAEAICTLALSKPLTLLRMHWSCNNDEIQQIADKHLSSGILGLARHGKSLNVFHQLNLIGGHEPFIKLRGALMTFSAALRQERDPVACLLYVISAESLLNPPTR